MPRVEGGVGVVVSAAVLITVFMDGAVFVLRLEGPGIVG
jgi:hypothetical protein